MGYLKGCRAGGQTSGHLRGRYATRHQFINQSGLTEDDKAGEDSRQQEDKAANDYKFWVRKAKLDTYWEESLDFFL